MSLNNLTKSVSMKEFVDHPEDEFGEQFHLDPSQMPRALAAFARVGPENVHKLIREKSLTQDQINVSRLGEIVGYMPEYAEVITDELRSFDDSTVSLKELADVVGTLIKDLRVHAGLIPEL